MCELKTASESWAEYENNKASHDLRLEFFGDGVEIDGHYWVEKSRIDNAGKLLKWMHQLMEKSWMDKEFALYFMEEVAKQYDIDIYGC